MRALGSFVRALRVKYRDIEVGLDVASEHGIADSGDLEVDLTDLLNAIGRAAAERGTAVVLFIDEIQYVPAEQLAALISALHRASQHQLPIAMIAAGLPQIVGQTGRAKSYAERLLEFLPIDASFFRVRFDRLTPAEKNYLRAMAELGSGPHRSGDIAVQIGRAVTAVAPIRNALIRKGMLFSPSHGDTAFTVPLFDGFMKRIMPPAS